MKRLHRLARFSSLPFAIAAVLGVGCTRNANVTSELTEKWGNESLYSIDAKSLEGDTVSLGSYGGQVVLVVNTASACGFTKQYSGLQELHDEYKDLGFSVLGFPSNDFGGQEPGTNEEIREFCDTNYSIGFPLFDKVVTKDDSDAQSPVYEFLGTRTGKLPGWNFGKYLVGRDGLPIAYYDSKTKPDSSTLKAAIELALSVSPGG